MRKSDVKGYVVPILGEKLLNVLLVNSVETGGCCGKYWLDKWKVR